LQNAPARNRNVRAFCSVHFGGLRSFIVLRASLVLCALRSAPRGVLCAPYLVLRASCSVPLAPCFVLRASCSVLFCAAFSTQRLVLLASCSLCASCSAPRALVLSAPRALRLVLCAPRPLPWTPRSSSCSAPRAPMLASSLVNEPRAPMLYRCSVIRVPRAPWTVPRAPISVHCAPRLVLSVCCF
jgi:hypothetical protein